MRLTLVISALPFWTGLAFAVDQGSIRARPANFNDTSNPNKLSDLDSMKMRIRPSCEFANKGSIVAGYYPNWGIYGRNFFVQNIDPRTLTHIHYAFANMDGVTGQALLSDPWADQQITFNGDNSSEPGHNVYGNLKQLYLHKLKQPYLNTILTFGGYTYSQDGSCKFMGNKTSRATFVETSIQLMEDNGFDGLEIDCQWPKAGEEQVAFVSLLKELRAGLHAHAKKKNDKHSYLLVVTVPAGSQDYVNLNLHEINKHVDYMSATDYDFAGSWSQVTDYLANVYGGAYSGVSIDAGVNYFLANGVKPSKFVMGMPLYGRGFGHTNGIFQPFEGLSSGGKFEAGVYDVKELPLPGSTVTEDRQNISSYSYDPEKKELISFDTAAIASMKADYVLQKGLGGVVLWELSGDQGSTGSRVLTVANRFRKLHKTKNHLNYPFSQFDNIRSNMNWMGL